MYEPSNVMVRDGLVHAYDKKRKTTDMVYIDDGLLALKRTTLDMIPDGEVSSLEDVLTELVRRKELAAYETLQRFYTIGTVEELKEFKTLTASGEIAP